MFKNLKDKRVLSFITYRFLVSMFLVLVCTLISSALSYDVIQKKMSEWSISVNNKLIKNYNDVFKAAVITNSEKIFQQILLDSYNNNLNMKNMKYILNSPVENNLLELKDISNYFVNMAQANPLVSEVGIFVTGSHLIISNETVKYDYFYDFYDEDIAIFISKSEEIQRSGEVDNLTAYTTDGTMQMIRPIMAANKVIGLVFVEYSTDAVNKKLKESLVEDLGTFLVLNNQGVVIFDNSGENSGKNYKQLSFYNNELEDTDNGYYFKKENKISSIISYMTDSGNWRYISVIPEQFYMEPVQYVLKNLLICTLAAIFVGMLFTIAMSLWQSKPMNKIIELCDETSRPNTAIPPLMDAYGFIRSTLTGLMSKVENQTQEINKLMPILRNNFADWFMSAKPTDASDVNDTMLLMHVEFPFERYAIIAIKAVLTSEDAVVEESEFETNYALAEARLVLESAFNKNDSIGVFSLGLNNITGLINFSCSNGAFQERCEGLFKQAFHGFRFHISSGQISTELEVLAGTANSVIEALRYSYLYPEYSYFSYEFLRIRTIGKDERGVLDDISSFSVAVKHKDAEHAADIINTIVEKLRHGGCAVQYAQKIMLETSSIIEKFSSRSELSRELMVAFQACKDIIAMQKVLKNITIKELSGKPETLGNPLTLVNAGKDYIDHNLTNTQLSLQMVSDELKVTTQYFSQIFHEAIGMTFTDYITAEKMKMACKLLMETNMNIVSISEKIGYSSPQYFIRRFRMHFGTTPSAYRENMKNELMPDVIS